MVPEDDLKSGEILLQPDHTGFRVDTERLIIREFTPDMAQVVHENSLDGNTRRFVPDEVFETVEEAREAIGYLMARYEKMDGPQVYPVLIRSTADNIGYVQLVPLEGGRWEIGYHIAGKYTGNGYATEAVRAFLPVIAGKVGIREVWGICLAENVASRHVLKNCGFQVMDEGPGEYHGETREIIRSLWTTP